MKITILFSLLFCLYSCSSATQSIIKCSAFQQLNKIKISDTYNKNRKLWKCFNSKYGKEWKITNSKNGKEPYRKLVVFMDGTRNEAKDKTNIWKMYELSVQHACKGNPVIPYYDKGVGTKWNVVSGAFAGKGVSKNIRQAYRFLVEAYEPGDKIFIFGFSRGAFTARSLNGMIELAGLLDKNCVNRKLCKIDENDLKKKVKAIYECYHIEKQELVKPKIDDLRTKTYPDLIFHKEVKVNGIGVFETVAALGVRRKEEPKKHHFYDLYAKRGYHALSIDEQRKDFQLVRFELDDNINVKSKPLLKEVWFSGVHSDVGGGYDSSKTCTCSLGENALNWMLSNFRKDDIFFEKDGKTIFNKCSLGEMHDEYYSILPPYLLQKKNPRKNENGINEGDLVHESVFERMAGPLCKPHPKREKDGKYRPDNLDMKLKYKKVSNDGTETDYRPSEHFDQ